MQIGERAATITNVNHLKLHFDTGYNLFWGLICCRHNGVLTKSRQYVKRKYGLKKTDAVNREFLTKYWIHFHAH
jgi:hypothetical protein